MTRTAVFLLALLAALTSARPAPGTEAADAQRVLVGVNYFAGWWEALPNKWHGKGWTAQEADWRPAFPDRVPLLGCYNVPATMEREIAAAADHGVDFFSILWYYPQPGSGQEEQARWLNRGLETFLAAPNAGRLRFMIEYCNAPRFDALDDADWTKCVSIWTAALRHASALRVGERLVFKIHDAARFIGGNGRDVARCRRQLDELRRAVRAAGLGDMVIGGGVMSRSQIRPGAAVAQVFDFTATYMSIPEVEVRPAEHPYADLAAEARAARRLHAHDPVPYVPYLAAGWNPRPWTHPQADANHRRFFTFPTRAEWTAELQALKRDLEQEPGLGFPAGTGGRQRAVTIYAWNEFGEGGIVAPTQGAGAMKLKAIRDVFAPHLRPTEK